MLAVLSLLPFLGPLSAQDPDPRVTAIRAAVTEALKSNRAVMIAVVQKGKVILADAKGRLEDKLEANAKTLFPLGDASQVVANLVLARMQAAGQLDLGKKVSESIPGFTLRDAKGVASEATLRELLAGEIGFPEFRNHLPQKLLKEWTARRAVLDHAVVTKSPGSPNALSYAIVQVAAETALEKRWAEIAQGTLRAQLGLDSLVVDVRDGFPKQGAQTFKEGLFGMTTPERSGNGAIPSATGVWAEAADVAKILQELTRVSTGAVETEAVHGLPDGKIEFAGFSSPWGYEAKKGELVHSGIQLTAGGPGMCGGVYVYPQYETAWAVFVNERSQHEGMPPKLKSALEKALLPKPRDKPKGWGGRWGGRRAAVPKPFDEKRRGTWVADIRVKERPLKLRMVIREARVAGAHLDGNRPRRAFGTRHRAKQLYFEVANLLPLRKDRSLTYGFDLRWVEGKEPGWRGFVRAYSRDYCDIRFPVSFQKLAPK